MTCISKRICVRKKKNVYIYCKIFYRKLNRYIIICFICAYDATIANIY